MSLHARIAIGASRRALRLETSAVVGGLGLVAATVAVRFASLSALAIGIVAIASVLVVAMRPTRETSLVVLGESARVEVHRSAGRVDAFVLDEGSLLWPGLAVLRLVPASFSGARPRTVVAFDGDLDEVDLRGLRRHLLWVSRGGIRPEPATDRSSR